MNLKFVVIVGLSVLAAFGVACSSPTPIPTPVPTLAPVVATPVPATATPTILPTATQIPSATRVPPTLTPTATPTQTPPPDPKNLLLAAMNLAIPKLKTYRVEMVEEGRDIEVVLPDRFRQVGWDPIVKIGGTYYSYDFTGKPFTRPAGNVSFFDRANLIWFRDQFTQTPKVSALGPATIGGVLCIGYGTTFIAAQVSPPKSPDATPVVTQIAQPIKIWFGVQDGFPRRIEMGAPLPLTINFLDFNAQIQIDPLK